MLSVACLVAVCVAGSFSCSLAEASLYSITRARIETLRRHRHRSGEILARLRDNIDEPIAAILILNTVINTGLAAWIAAQVVERFGSHWMGLFSAGFTLAILMFGEIVPKNIGYKFANAVAPVLARPMSWLVTLLWPAVRAITAFTGLFGRRARLAPVPEDDIISLAAMSVQGGGIRGQEARWVVNALHLDKLTAREVMTPALVVWRVSADMPLKMAVPEADSWRFSRLPVCDPADDTKIVGVVERRRVFDELVAGGGERTTGELMAPAVFVEESLPAHTLLDMFIKRRVHLFCVRDAAGAWSGIVTLEDVLEALLGQEIVGEQDLYEDMQQAAREAERTQALARELKSAGAVIEVVTVEKGAALSGRSLREAALPQNVVIGTIVRRGIVVVPHGKTRLKPGDHVTLIGKQADVEKARVSLIAAPTENAS